MADQLFDIINTSLTNTQLGAGDYTILTTDANTSYVIKDLYVSSNNAAIPVSLTLKVNDVPSGTFTGNASGTEIIPPNSIVKVNGAPIFPLTYLDTNAIFYDNTGTYGIRKVSSLSVSGVVDPVLSGSTFTSISSISDYTSNEGNYTIKFLNPTGTRLITLQKDNNSVTNLYVRGAGGTYYQETTSYAPKAYDGSRYAYWYADNYVYRVDLNNDFSQETLVYVPSGTQTTYARSWVSSGLNQVFMFNHGASNPTYAVNTTTFTYWNIGTLAGVYSTNLNIASSWDAANNQYNLAIMRSATQCDIYTIKVGSAAAFQKQVSLPLTVDVDRGAFYMEDRKVIFMNNDDLWSVDLDSLVAVKILTVGSGNYSNNMFIYSKSIPSASTIASRTYSINPAIGVRAVGIKTT